MKKILITGISGFVGHHFLEYLYHNDTDVIVCGVDIAKPDYKMEKYASKFLLQYEIVNLLDKDALKHILGTFQPQYILHLASYSSVAYSWEHPEKSFVNNTNIFLNLIMAIRELDIDCRVLSVGSSEEYGIVQKEDVPLAEEREIHPISPYAVARVSQEMLSKVFSDSYGLSIIMTRSFNHIGPWQDERFVVSSFIKRIKAIKEQKEIAGIIETGDISIIRDFVDVRDVVNAYYLLLMKGRAGEIYNVCSGKGIALSEIINIIAEELNLTVQPQICDKYIRPNDNPVIIGNNQKIVSELGWSPEIPLRKTLQDMIAGEEQS